MAKWYSPHPEYNQISERDYNVRCLIEKVLGDNTINMENYGYFGSNMGCPEDRYDDVAEEIMTSLNLWEKPNVD